MEMNSVRVLRYAGLQCGFLETDRFKFPDTMDSKYVEYLSALVTHSYGGDEGVRQAIFDALSPFQTISKLWAVYQLQQFAPALLEGQQNFIFIGSWFGQLPMMFDRAYRHDYKRYGISSKLLVDKDHTAQYIAEKALHGRLSNVEFECADIFNKNFQLDTSNDPIIVWTGIEHFYSEQVDQRIQEWRRPGMRFLLQGTNMPAEDHVNPVNSISDLEQYFHGGQVKYQGQLETTLGTRYMVAYTT